MLLETSESNCTLSNYLNGGSKIKCYLGRNVRVACRWQRHCQGKHIASTRLCAILLQLRSSHKYSNSEILLSSNHRAAKRTELRSFRIGQNIHKSTLKRFEIGIFPSMATTKGVGQWCRKSVKIEISFGIRKPPGARQKRPCRPLSWRLSESSYDFR